jgi:hypothetical protein
VSEKHREERQEEQSGEDERERGDEVEDLEVPDSEGQDVRAGKTPPPGGPTPMPYPN